MSNTISQEQKQFNKDKRKEQKANEKWDEKRFDKVTKLLKEMDDEMFLEIIKMQVTEKLEKLKSQN